MNISAPIGSAHINRQLKTDNPLHCLKTFGNGDTAKNKTSRKI